METQKRAGTPLLVNVGRLLGAVGLVLLVSTPLTWLLTEEMGALVWGKLLLSLALCGFYVATNADIFSRVAGARSTGLLALSGFSVVVAVGLVGVANYVAFKNPKEIDLTREGLYTLSDQTVNVLGRIKDEVTIYAFFSSLDPDFPTVEETLKRYKEKSQKLRYEMVDPQSRPDLVEKFGITERGPRIVIAARGQDTRAKDVNEEELTNGIVKVAEQSQKAIYFLTGHGEASIEDEENTEGMKGLAEAIRAEGYTVKTLNLLEAKGAAPGAKLEVQLPGHPSGHKDEPVAEGAGLEVPLDVAVLIIGGAKGKLLQPEVAALERWVQKGGRLIALLEPDSDAGLGTLLAQWKIAPQADLVVDTNPLNRLLGLGPAAPMVQPPEAQMEHPAVKALAAPVVLAASRSLKIAEGGMPGVDAQALLEAGESAWGETNLQGGSAAIDDKDNAGPVPVLVAAVRDVTETVKLNTQGRVVVAGDSEWANNKYLQLQGNGDMFLNLLNWMAEEEGRISIRPKTRQASQLFLTQAQMGQVKFFSLDILPVLIVAMGLGIVLIRRQR